MGVIDSTHYRVTCPACNAKDAPELSSMDLPMAGAAGAGQIQTNLISISNSFLTGVCDRVRNVQVW